MFRLRTNLLNTARIYTPGISPYLMLICLFSAPLGLQSQIVWQENFNTYPDGTQNAANWTSTFNDCDDADVNMGNNFWGVSSGAFRVNDIEGFNCSGGGGDNRNEFITNPIDISTYECVDISLDIDGAGGLECDFPAAPNYTASNSHDQLVVEYSVNGGGTWTELIYICGETSLPTTATANNIAGNSLLIRVLAGNKANAEYYTFDNILVENATTTPTLTAIGPFCSADPSVPLSTNQGGTTGSWSGPGVIAGNSFNPNTANVGSNTLTFTPNPGQCANTNSMTVTVNAGPDVDDIPNQTACGSYTLPVISGSNLSGGAAFYTGSGGTGVPLTTGQNITAATTTTLYIYDMNGGCSDEEQFDITITPLPDINDLADPSACGSYTLPNITGSNLTGNEAYFTQTGRAGIQLSPGQVITTTTTLFIHGGAGSCSDEEQVTITITPAPDVDDLADISVCGSYTLPAITGTNLTGNEAYFTQTGGGGTQYSVGQNLTSTTSLFIYDEAGTCNDEETVTITISPPPTVDDLPNQTACVSYTLPTISGTNLTGNEAYYTQSGGSGTSFNPGQIITNTTTLFIYDGSGVCSDEESFTITITSPPAIDDLPNTSACGSFTLPAISGTNLTGNEAYYTQTGGNGTSFSPGQSITGTTTLFIYGGAGSCTDEEQFTITITPPPDVSDIPDQTHCGSFTLPAINGTNLTGNQAYYTGANGTGIRYEIGQMITSTTNLFIYDGVPPCDDQEQFTVTITPAPDITGLPTQNVCGSYVLPAITGTNLTGNEAYFTNPNRGGTQLAPGQIITTSVTLFIHAGTGSCSDEELFSINVTPQPVIDIITDPTTCGNYTLPAITGTDLTGNEAYYTSSGGLGTSFSPGQIISTSTSLFIYDGSPGCSGQVEITITINPPIDIDDLADQTACASFTLPQITGTNLTGNQAYYTASGGQGTQLNPGENITTTTTLFIYDGSPGCEDEQQVTITITPAPTIDDLADQTACASFTLPQITGTNLTGNEAYFTASGGQGTQLNPGENITTTTTLFIYDGSPGCEDEQQVTITITPAPTIDDLADQTACASFTLPQITGTNLTGNEAYFTASGGQGTQLNPGENITTTTTLFIYDENGSCSDEQAVTIAIVGQPSLDPIEDVSRCGSFTLPPITGTGLSGNQAYFTETDGQGTRMMAGDTVDTSITLYAYDGAAGCQDQFSFSITITPGPDITPLSEQTACGSYTLPTIIGTNLTGNEAYYTEVGGSGTRWEVGDIINSSQTLFIYDGTDGCQDDEGFSITILPEAQIDDIPDQVVCDSFLLPNITGVNLSGNEAYYDGPNGSGNTFQTGDVIDSDQVLFIWDNNNGCNNQQVFEIIVNAAPEIELVAAPVTCAGGNDASLVSSVVAGIAPFTYNWNFDQFDGQDTLLDIPAGNYSLSLTDGNNCTTTVNASIDEPTPIGLHCQESMPVSSIGGTDGVADIDLAGGTVPYVLTWDNVADNGSEVINDEGILQLGDLAAGNYNVLVLDSNDCEASCTFTITDPACSLSIMATATDASCHDSNDGSMAVITSGGQGPFTFNWSDPTLNGRQDVADLPPGDYMLTVMDANGCEVITSATVTAPAELSLSGLSVTPVSASGENDGGVSVSYQGGTPPYQIGWEGELFGSLGASEAGVFALNIFPEGDYILRVTDSNGCQASIDFTIPGVNCNLSLGLQGQDLACFEDQSGQIQLTITGGISPLAIDWGIDSLNGLRLLPNLAAGDYQVVVTDANGCSATENISLQQPTLLSVVCSPLNEASAPSANDGSVSIEVAGGEPNYTIDWSNGVISGSENLFVPDNVEIDGLSAGDYEVFVMDHHGCMTTCGVEVTAVCPTSESTFAPTLCAGESVIINGNTYDSERPSGQEVLLNANSLGCDSIVTIDLQFLPAATANIDRQLCQGESLTIGVMEFNIDNPIGTAILPNASPDGCDSVIMVALSFLEAPVFSLEGNSTICPGEAATLTFRASYFNGTVDIMLQDSDGQLTSVTGLVDGSSIEVAPTASTTYRIMDTNANEGPCPPVITGEASIEVTNLVIDLLATDYNGFQVSCAQATDGAIEVLVEGATAPYSYQWSNGSTSPNLADIGAGLYELTLTDARGCMATSEILLSAPNALDAILSILPPACNGHGGTLIIENISGGTAPFSLSLGNNTPQSISGLPFTQTALEAGNYDLSLQDANGCLFTTDLSIPNEEPLLLDIGEDMTIKLGETATIYALSNFTVAEYIWEPADTMAHLGNGTFQVSPNFTTVYTLTAFDAAGCSVSDQITVIVDRKVDLYQPTAFSPNHDGANDVFQVFAGPSVVRINSFFIFDRWGNILYKASDYAPKDPSHGWDGTYQGQPMNAGVYVYYLEVTFVDGRTELIKGDVALLR